MENLLKEDLDRILEHTEQLWDDIRGGRIFITGGTGFIGTWLLESFARANERLDLKACAHVLTRNPEAFFAKAPHLAASKSFRFHTGDVRSFVFPSGSFSHVIHAATEASAKMNVENPLLMLDTIVEGTRRTLEFARQCQCRTFLLTSSGAVYGRQRPEVSNMPEDYVGAPDPVSSTSAYGEGKRIAELLCTVYAEKYGIAAKIARCFAFVGPYLPLDVHFAVGNFIRDGLQGRAIRILGNGAPYRSYLYAADMTEWLWTLFFRGESCKPYNVGSERSISISELAAAVARCFQPSPTVHIAEKIVEGVPAPRYVPATGRAKQELSLKERVGLEEALQRTIRWHEKRSVPG
ncbi:MAG: NAD-dependent epimerase/dehydratase family protein [Geobacteraceae bacterium]|nr:NAD-dependent epimerase/dehydratase family protein [Geobacteraceae bacterium]